MVAGLRAPFAKEEAERLRTWLLEGGNLLLAASPIAARRHGLVPALERVLGPFGIALDDDVVTEQEADVALPDSGGFRFVAQPRQHPMTTGAREDEATRATCPRVVVSLTRSMHRATEPGAVNPAELLGTSPRAFGLHGIEGAADWKETPQKRPGDSQGRSPSRWPPSVRGRRRLSPHGPRIVVVGTCERPRR